MKNLMDKKENPKDREKRKKLKKVIKVGTAATKIVKNKDRNTEANEKESIWALTPLNVR